MLGVQGLGCRGWGFAVSVLGGGGGEGVEVLGCPVVPLLIPFLGGFRFPYKSLSAKRAPSLELGFVRSGFGFRGCGGGGGGGSTLGLRAEGSRLGCRVEGGLCFPPGLRLP